MEIKKLYVMQAEVRLLLSSVGYFIRNEPNNKRLVRRYKKIYKFFEKILVELRKEILIKKETNL